MCQVSKASSWESGFGDGVIEWNNNASRLDEKFLRSRLSLLLAASGCLQSVDHVKRGAHINSELSMAKLNTPRVAVRRCAGWPS